MASHSPKLLPESPGPTATVPAARRAHVHLMQVQHGWDMRFGGRVEKSFASEIEAALAAIPFARERDARLFVHYESGEVRETGTSLADETMMQMWQMTYESRNERVD